MAPDDAQPDTAADPSGLHPDVLARLSPVLGEHLTDVFAKHREVETRTGERNIIGRQNLVEALAHIGVLFQQARELDRDEQLAQLAYLEDHLRRVMMESFEEEVYAIIGEAWNQDDKRSVRRLYDAHAAPAIRREKLLGHVTPDEVEQRFTAISLRVVAARRAKVADAGWTAWKDASDDLKDAAEQLQVLKREMGAAVDAARSASSARNRWIVSLVVGVVLGLGTRLLF